MKIATYNLRFGGKSGHRIHWRKVLDNINPDIFLVQETLPPQTYVSADFYQAARSQFHWRAVSERPWGSAIYVSKGQVVPLPPLSVGFSGWVTGAKVSGCGWPLGDSQSLYIYSVHAPSIGSSYVKQMNLILDSIKEQIPADSMVIIGGDFNLTVGLRHPSEALQQNCSKLMARFRQEFGLMNCWQMVHPNQDLPQTLRWSNDKTKPYHCDGIFAPACWYRYLENAEVLSDDSWHGLSDHNPITASFVFPL
ncbi:MAG: endonuclease/exonuclease/phosphatase family protein [Cyanobacteria bacterium P01_F01_bin.53]